MQQLNPASPPALAAFAVLAACYLLAAAFFLWSKNAALKRALLPYAAVVLGGLFLAWLWQAGIRQEALYTFGPLVALMVWFGARSLQFCGACGRTVRGAAIFSRPKFCPKCGEALRVRSSNS